MALSRTLSTLRLRSTTLSTYTTRNFSSSLRRRDQIPFNISGNGAGVAQVVKVDNSSHTINTDAYPAFGGADKYPSTLHFNLTALSSCTQVTGAIVAKDHAINIDSWDVKVEGKTGPVGASGGRTVSRERRELNFYSLSGQGQVASRAGKVPALGFRGREKVSGHATD